MKIGTWVRVMFSALLFYAFPSKHRFRNGERKCGVVRAVYSCNRLALSVAASTSLQTPGVALPFTIPFTITVKKGLRPVTAVMVLMVFKKRSPCRRDALVVEQRIKN
ncbi:hypothetical protein CHL67_00910 [Prosthecochloris sp. GSB1]|nr:hypothetical protein CHL67_00910 [Prosthecochloris sp. GSB1]